MEVTLRAYQGSRLTGDCKLSDGETLIGRREDCGLRFHDLRLSREHCKLIVGDQRCAVVDLSSSNGTFVNGRRIQEAELKDGDRITVGGVHLVIRTPFDANNETATAAEVNMNSPNESSDMTDYGHYSPDGRVDPHDSDRGGFTRSGPGAEIKPGAITRATVIPSSLVPGPSDILSPGGGGWPVDCDVRISMRQILNYRKTIALTAVAIFIPSILAIWTLMKPLYSATGQVRVRPIIPHLVFQTEESGTIPFYQSYLNTQVGVMRSPIVLQRVLDLSEVQATGWYDRVDPFWMGPRTKLERLGADLSVQPRGLTELIDVSVRDTSSADATVIVNAVLGQYLKYLSERSEEGSDIMFRQLAREFEQLDASIRGRQGAAAKLRKELGTGNPQELVSGKRVRLDQMQSEVTTVRRNLALAKLRKSELDSRLNPKMDPVLETANMQLPGPRYQTDPEWNRLKMAMKLAKHQVAMESQRLGYAHPTMLALKQQVAFAEELLISRQQQLNGQWPVASSLGYAIAGPVVLGVTPAQELEELNWQVKLLAQEEQLLLDDIAKQKALWADTFDRAEILGAEMSSIDQKKQLHEAVRNRLEQKRMERNVPGSIEILASAVEPSLPASDRRLVFTALVMIAGIVTGMGIAYMRASSDQAIYQTGELAGAAPAPFLGLLPQITAAADKCVADDPTLNESIRMARTSLLQQMGNRKGNVIVITSAECGVGKTTVSTMLARSLAKAGKRALLIDADLRNPSVAAHLDLHPLVGFVEAISGQATDSQAIISTDDPRLDVLPGRISKDGFDPELIANGAFSSALARWRASYDVILLDCPPVLVVADASILARHADGTILIAWAGRSQRSEIRQAMESLNSAGGSLMGTIFIQQKYRSRYGQTHSYGYGAQS